MADDTLIKGWEVAKRTCNGRARAPLRAAARDVNAIRESVLAGTASESTCSSYLVKIETLYKEMAKAGEQDFDGMLKEALGWIEAKKDGTLGERLPTPSALTPGQTAALERIRDYRFTNSPGHIGKAIDRDLRVATEIAKEVRAGLSAMAAAAGQDELVVATATYVDAADRFCSELARAGEPDFDGLLRQAVLVLDSAPGGQGAKGNSGGGKKGGGKGRGDGGKGLKGDGGKGWKGEDKGWKGSGKAGKRGGKFVGGYNDRPDPMYEGGNGPNRRWQSKAAKYTEPDESLVCDQMMGM